jgi:hypothetical protein
MRVVSWNVHNRGPSGARRQGALLRDLGPDLLLLQEVNPNSADVLRQCAGADWMVRADELASPLPGGQAHPRVAAVAGYGPPPHHACLLPGAAQAHALRTLIVTTSIDGVELTACSYHAPNGSDYKIEKARQAVAFAHWLSAQPGPLLFGADANTPKIDAPEFADTRTHWHSGDRKLQGEPGDDLLFGPAKIHTLEDALRRWLADHPGRTATFADSPLGPLAITHRTGRRKDSPGTGRRFDSIWITCHWTVQHIEHLYDEGIAAGSDHAVVVADLLTAHKPGAPNTDDLSPQPAHRPLTPGKPSAHTPLDTRTPGADGPAEEFIHGRYCRDCGWPFPASHNRTHCQVQHACKRRQELPLRLRSDGCPRNDRVHPEWGDLHS